MKITDIRIKRIEEKKNDSKLLAYVAITFDDSLVLHNIKIIKGKKGYFVAMPNVKNKMGEFKDIVHPINQEFRKFIQDSIFKKFSDDFPGELELGVDNLG